MMNSAAAWPVLTSPALQVRGTLHSRLVRFTGHRRVCACQCETRVALCICGIIMRRYYGQRMQRFLQTQLYFNQRGTIARNACKYLVEHIADLRRRH